MTNLELKKDIFKRIKHNENFVITASCEIENSEYANCYITLWINDDLDHTYDFNELNYNNMDCDDKQVQQMYKQFKKTTVNYLTNFFNVIDKGCFNI